MSGSRGQSHVVGVALLMGVTVLALGALTAGVGGLVSEHAAAADATRVAEELGAALDPVETTGRDSGRVHFSDGRLETVERQVRVLDSGGVRHRIDAGGLVFTAGDRRVAYVADAIVRGTGEGAWLHEPPPLTAPVGGEVLIVSVARLNASHAAVAGRDVSVTLQSTVTHERIRLGNGTFRVAVETATPAALGRWFRTRNATTSRRDFDGDDVPSIVARIRRNRTGYLVVHDVALEVGHG
ncbi:MAG: hypothetical protein ABEJ30_06155 [Halorientalis sp.]